MHAALADNFEQKIESYEDLPIAGVIALFREAWAIEREQTEFRDDEDPAELAACGEILVAKYLDEWLLRLSRQGWSYMSRARSPASGVQGWVDLLDVNGRIIDIKTSARKTELIDPEYRFQIATYSQLTPGANGEARIDTLVKTKTPVW